MAVKAAVLQPGRLLPSAFTTLYTVPTGATAVVKRALFTNTSGAAVIVGVQVVRAGSGAVGVVVQGHSVAAGETWVSAELTGLVLASGDLVSAGTSTGAVVSCVISGFTM